MVRLGVFLVVTLIGLYLVMLVFGSGDLRAGRDGPQPRAIAPEKPDPRAEARRDPAPRPAPEVVEAAAQTPQKVQEFPGPPLQPSPEYAGRTPQDPAQAPPGTQGPVFYVTGNRVNFRAGPSTGDRVIGSLSQGAAVEVLGPTDDAWINIRDSDGRVGYMSAQFLSQARP
ncbi:MAG: SH3 domain-containing protein [Paracoccus sp. (in: a-proteobacteria)]|uniref:SH3 domain-containing protein n=1 Tax=unclassified Paracoccus (in: a-proteobacteria) TaxID=2688777 RepID=UPI0025DED1AA|nr:MULTISPECIES: SH3 domain-containing protein [unclassified Paracoccus (in: a-proteobacteria)]|tara:strand:+ start:1686 stop:2195 length:510 start_codon:yes stop_codon:yes gene_type:complete